MSKPVEFVEELPAGRTGPHPELLEFAQALRDNPGRWALHPRQPKEGSASTLASRRAWSINSGQMISLPAGEFEATGRKGKLYVRAKVTE